MRRTVLKTKARSAVVLRSLIDVSTPLPLVDWFDVLTNMSRVSVPQCLLVLEFTSKNAVQRKSASSLSDTLVHILTHCSIDRTEILEEKEVCTFVTTKALEALFDVAGLGEQGEGSDVVRVSRSRVLDIVDGIARWLTDSSRPAEAMVFDMCATFVGVAETFSGHMC